MEPSSTTPVSQATPAGSVIEARAFSLTAAQQTAVTQGLRLGPSAATSSAATSTTIVRASISPQPKR